jgi:hypothetical protein
MAVTWPLSGVFNVARQRVTVMAPRSSLLRDGCRRVRGQEAVGAQGGRSPLAPATRSARDVDLDEVLTVAARTMDGATVEFSHLSGGAKERLAVCARLAFASLISKSMGLVGLRMV